MMNSPPDLASALPRTASALDSMMQRVWSEFAPPEKMTIDQWAERYREMSPEESAIPGRFSLAHTPVLRAILQACGDPTVRKVAVMKSAQIGYSAGIVCNVLGYHVHHKPSVQLAVFPRSQSAKDFASEKFDPMVRATKPLAERIALKSRAAGNSATRKHYAGGLIKLVGSNSPSDVKSTSARVVIIEEPDDASTDVRGQGDAIKLAEERAKSFPDSLILIGGTPTAKGASSIEAEIASSDQRKYFVECPHCIEEHVPTWSNVCIPEDEDAPPREIYGRHRWERAYYACPACGAAWTEEERHAAIRAGHFEPTAQATGCAGFLINELLSVFAGSRIPVLARKYLEAKFKESEGDNSELIAFTNSTLGEPFEYRGELPEESALEARAETYAEWTVPDGGMIPLLAVDVQHDRLAASCWVVGRREEMWLAFWGELHGQTVVPHAGAWLDLDQLLDQTVQHASGARLMIAAVAIDSSDGQTSDAVYSFVRDRNRHGRPVFAIKGASDSEGKIELWRPPSPTSVDPHHTGRKSAKYGVKVQIVGAAKGKDAILGWAQEGGRVRLTGDGPMRMHWYKTVRPDFYEQLLSEIKIPQRNNPRRRAWKKRTDRNNEALDTTVYALWLLHALGLHVKKPAWWDHLETKIRQRGIFDSDAVEPVDDAPAAPTTDAEPAAAPIKPSSVQPLAAPSRPKLPRRIGGVGVGRRPW